MMSNEHMEEIIYRRLNNEATADEEKELLAWLNESPDNRHDYDELERIWKESARLAYDTYFDRTKAWEVVEKKISTTAYVNNHTSKKIPFHFVKIAASMVILIAAASLVYYYYHSNQKKDALISIAASGANKKLRLPDGSFVTLRQGSSIRYHANFGMNKRDLNLSGEAYFEILHNEAAPFTIFTRKCVIEDIGTSFFIRSTDNEERVFVETGTVKVTDKSDSSVAVILNKKQASKFVGKVFETDSVTDDNYLSWKSGLLKFDNVSLKKMVAELNNYYKSNIVLSGALESTGDSIRVNLSFEGNSLNQVLDEIHMVTGLTVQQSKDSIVILNEK
ncbi:MAG TPA: FecR domain-containing protein [Puia sp.]|nr:FecR domain-containing protein [Puia sp.]